MTEASAPKPPTGERKRSRRWLLEAGVVGAAYVGLTSFQTSDLLASGTVVPPFTTNDLMGQRLTLGSFAGQPLVVHFWASWCGVCRQEFGMLNDFHEQRGSLLALVAEEPSNALVEFVRSHDLRYPIAYAPPALVQAYRVSAFPTTYYLSKDHTISSATVGMSISLAMRARLMLAS